MEVAAVIRSKFGYLLAIVLFAGTAAAAEFEAVTLPDGTALTYAVALPDGFSPDNTYPLLLAFPPGGQDENMVRAGLDAYWEAEGTRRGFVVISPVAPGALFFRGSAQHIGPFLDYLTTNYRVRDGRVDVAGVSNGGLSAFRTALDEPARVRSLTVVPGFPPEAGDFANLAALDGITVSMFVGENDGGWREPMQRVSAALSDLGQTPFLQVEPGQGHFVRSLAGPAATVLFDQMTR